MIGTDEPGPAKIILSRNDPFSLRENYLSWFRCFRIIGRQTLKKLSKVELRNSFFEVG